MREFGKLMNQRAELNLNKNKKITQNRDFDIFDILTLNILMSFLLFVIL